MTFWESLPFLSCYCCNLFTKKIYSCKVLLITSHLIVVIFPEKSNLKSSADSFVLSILLYFPVSVIEFLIGRLCFSISLALQTRWETWLVDCTTRKWLLWWMEWLLILLHILCLRITTIASRHQSHLLPTPMNRHVRWHVF